MLREVKAFEDSVGVQLEAGAHAVEENVGRSAAVTESKLRELADAQARPSTAPHFQTAPAAQCPALLHAPLSRTAGHQIR